MSDPMNGAHAESESQHFSPYRSDGKLVRLCSMEMEVDMARSSHLSSTASFA